MFFFVFCFEKSRSVMLSTKYLLIKKNATMYQNSIIPYLYEAQQVSGETPPIIRSLELQCQPLVFHT
jgi:hypothetical protein